jgi:hypothetical protein
MSSNVESGMDFSPLGNLGQFLKLDDCFKRMWQQTRATPKAVDFIFVPSSINTMFLFEAKISTPPASETDKLIEKYWSSLLFLLSLSCGKHDSFPKGKNIEIQKVKCVVTQSQITLAKKESFIK